MDFHSMKRKQLQALCKNHNITANLTNSEMANKLASLLKEKEISVTRGRSCLKNLGERVCENDLIDVKRQIKKVRFSPENEMIEFVDSRAHYVEMKRGKRRKSVVKKEGLVIENVDNIEAYKEIEEEPVRTTRSRGRKSPSGGVIPVISLRVEKKRSRISNRFDSLEVGGCDGGDNLASDVEKTRVFTRSSSRNREVISKKSEEVEEDVAVSRKNQTRRRSSKKNDVKTSDEISEDAAGGITQPEMALRRSKRNEKNVKDYALLNRGLVENQTARRGTETKVEAFGKLEVVLQLEEPLKRNRRKVRDNGLLNGDLVENGSARRKRTTWSQTQLPDNGPAPEGSETEVEGFGKLEVVLQLEEPSKCSGRGGNRRKSIMPQIEKVATGGAIMRPRRGFYRQESVEVCDVVDGNLKQSKRRRETIIEENVVREGDVFVEEPPSRRSTRIAAKPDTAVVAVGTGKAVRREKLQSRLKLQNAEVKPLADTNLAIKEPPAFDVEVSIPEIAGSESSTVLNGREAPNDGTIKNSKELSEKSLSVGVSIETSGIEEVKAVKMVNSVEILAPKSVKLQIDDDLASHSCNRDGESDSNNLFDPEPDPKEDLNASIDVGSTQTTSIDDGYSPVNLTDCVDNLDIGKEMEGGEEPETTKHIDTCCAVVSHEVDDDEASVLRAQKLVELEDSDSVGEPVKPEFVVEDCVAESNESGGSKKYSGSSYEEAGKLSVCYLSGMERIGSTKAEDIETDEAEKSVLDAEEFEDHSMVVNVVITGITSGADGSSTINQAEHVGVAATPSCNLTLSGHFEMEQPVPRKYTPSRVVNEVDSAAEEDKCSVLEVQNFLEFEEVSRFAEPSTHERVCESHSTGPDQTGGTAEDCKTVGIVALVPSYGETITSTMVEQNNEATAKVALEMTNEFQSTSGCCSMSTQLTPLNAPDYQASLGVNNEILSSSKCTPLKDDSESALVNNSSPSEETASSHETEMDDARMQEGSNVSNEKNARLIHENDWEVVGLAETEDEEMICNGDASPNDNEDVIGDSSDESVDVELAGVDRSSYTSFDQFIWKDSHVGGDKESDDSRFCGNASKEDTRVEDLQLIVEAGIPPITSGEDINKTKRFKESSEGNDFIAKSCEIGAETDGQHSDLTTHPTRSALEYQAFDDNSKEMSVSGLRLSVDNQMQDEGTISHFDDIVSALVIQSAIVTEAKDNAKSIEGDLHPQCSKLSTEEEKEENFSEVAFWDSGDGKNLVAQLNRRSDASLVETPCKESEFLQDKITTEFIKSTSKRIKETNLLKQRENEGALALSGHLGISKLVLNDGAESAIRPAKGLDSSGTLSDTDADKNVILAVTEVTFDNKDSVIVTMEDTNKIMLQHDEMDQNYSNVDEAMEDAEIEKSISTSSEKLANRKEDEDLAEVANKFEGYVSQGHEVKFNDFAGHESQMVQQLEKGSFVTPHELVSAVYQNGEYETSVGFAGTKLQENEVKNDDLDQHKDGAIFKGDIIIVDNLSYAEEDISPEYFDHCSEEEVLMEASCSELNVAHIDGQDSESRVHQGDLSSNAEGREVTEVDQTDLFDDCGFTVSSLVSIDCNEDQDKSLPEDKDVGKEKIATDMVDNMPSYTMDGSNIEGNANRKQETIEEQLVGNQDTFLDGSGGLGLINLFGVNKTNSITEEDDEVHGSLYNFNCMIPSNGDTNEHAEQQRLRETMGYGASELIIESNMFSIWEINLLVGDEVMNSTSEISETQVIGMKDNANVIIVPEDQLGKHYHPKEGQVAETNDSCFASDDSVFEGDRTLKEEKDLTNKSNYCVYSKNDVLEVEKSSIPTNMTLTEISNAEGSELVALVNLKVDGFKTIEEETEEEAIEVCENALKPNFVMEDQSSQSTDLAADRGKLLNSTTMKRKNAEASGIQGTPKKLITTLDMKENAPSIKRDHLGSTVMRSTTKRRALEELLNQKRIEFSS